MANSDSKKTKKAVINEEPENIGPPRISPPVFLPPDFEPPTVRQYTEVHTPEPPPSEVNPTIKVRRTNLYLFLIITSVILLIGAWLIYYYYLKSDSDFDDNIMYEFETEMPASTVEKERIDTVKPVVEKPAVRENTQPKNVIKKEQPVIAKPSVIEKPSPVVLEKIPKGPSAAQLNTLLKKIAISDDNAMDEIRSILGNNLRVEGATNISNVQQLITDVSNGSLYKVTKVTTDTEGKVTSITVSK